MKRNQPSQEELLLEMRNITKEFPGVKALDGVTLSVRRGTVHALMGENGAGKSTLMKVLTGIHQADEGSITYLGSPYSVKNIGESQKLGISMIHQELNMMNHLTVAQNIFIGREPMAGKAFIKDGDMVKEAEKLLHESDLSMTEIAEKVGFSTVAYFIATFRARYRLTPNQYRKFLHGNAQSII